MPAPIANVAIIGTAFMGRAHSYAWRNVRAIGGRDANRCLIVGTDAARTAAAGEELGWADHSTDWREAVTREEISVVDVCTPGGLHAEIAIAALDAGKHVIVEKPLAHRWEDAVTMAEAATASASRGQLTLVGYNYRHLPAIQLARELIASGRIGTPRHVRLAFLQDWLSDETAPMSWRLRRASAGLGVVGDLGSHLVDLLRHLLDEEVTEVSGRLATFVVQRPGPEGMEPVDVDDAAWATLTTASGAIAQLEVSRVATGRKCGLEIEVFGSEGALRFDLQRLNELTVWESTGPVRDRGSKVIPVTEPEHPIAGSWWPPGHVVGWDSTFTNQLSAFLAAIEQGTPLSPGFAEALETERVVHAIVQSASQRGVSLARDEWSA